MNHFTDSTYSKLDTNQDYKTSDKIFVKVIKPTLTAINVKTQSFGNIITAFFEWRVDNGIIALTIITPQFRMASENKLNFLLRAIQFIA